MYKFFFINPIFVYIVGGWRKEENVFFYSAIPINVLLKICPRFSIVGKERKTVRNRSYYITQSCKVWKSIPSNCFLARLSDENRALNHDLNSQAARFNPRLITRPSDFPEHLSRFRCESEFFPRSEDHGPSRKSDDRIETFRNSDDRPLVRHAAHQLNVNVCLCVCR